MQAADRGFADVLTMSFPGVPELEQHHARAYEGFLELIGRAKSSGHLREDFTSRDLVLLLMAKPESSAPPPTPSRTPGAAWWHG
ncbi:hypothetical protein [Streptomyces sp. NPDC001843]|uniref:hypothetical protein n=1 Tax=Streptomyces sp. NPDC001843 TaxID=3364617 RepID=UPI00368A786F